MSKPIFTGKMLQDTSKRETPSPNARITGALLKDSSVVITELLPQEGDSQFAKLSSGDFFYVKKGDQLYCEVSETKTEAQKEPVEERKWSNRNFFFKK